jgi:hypothetical protein
VKSRVEWMQQRRHDRRPGRLAAMESRRRTAAESEAWGGNAIVSRNERPIIRPDSLENTPRHEEG